MRTKNLFKSWMCTSTPGYPGFKGNQEVMLNNISCSFRFGSRLCESDLGPVW